MDGTKTGQDTLSNGKPAETDALATRRFEPMLGRHDGQTEDASREDGPEEGHSGQPDPTPWLHPLEQDMELSLTFEQDP